ncbi:PspC domain-containing protein [Streptococcus pneumoniae]
MPKKRLMRDGRNKKIAGVCAGVANYFDSDPTPIRLIWGIAFFVYGAGLLPYLILWAVLPVDDGSSSDDAIFY